MGLSQENRVDVVKYRIERAFIALDQAKKNLQIKCLEVTANRLYYACFYAASALMVAYGITTSSHAGVKTMLGMHFVSKGLLPIEQGKTFSRLFEIRHSGDYDDFVYCDKAMIDEYLPKAISFIGSVKTLLQNK